MSKAYFRYLGRNYKMASIFFVCMYAVLTFIIYTVTGSSTVSRLNYAYILSCVLNIAACYVVPVCLFAWIHNRSSVDMFGALPLSKREMMWTGLAFSFLLIFGTSFVVTGVTTLVSFQAVTASVYLLSLLNAFLSTICLLLFNTALFLIANNLFDGIVILAAYSILPNIVDLTFRLVIPQLLGGTSEAFSSIATWGSPAAMTIENQYDITILSSEGYGSSTSNFHWEFPGIMILFIAVSLLLLRRHFVNRRLERAQQLSGDFLAYPLVINLYAALIFFTIFVEMIADTGTSSLWIAIALVFFIYLAAQFVYRRTLRPTRKMLLGAVLVCVLSLVLAFASWNSKCFGMAYNYQEYTSGVTRYYYNAVVLRSDLGKAEKKLSQNSDEDDVEDDTVSVIFTLDIPTSDEDKYKEVIDIMKEMRDTSIDNYYSHNNTDAVSCGTLDVSNVSGNDSVPGSKDYSYDIYSNNLIREEELKTISKYTDDLSVTAEDKNGDMTDFTLQEFLEGR